MSRLFDLLNEGQSIWLDFIRRDLLESGELMSMRDRGVRGVTSNPSIFEAAIAKSNLYDHELAKLATEGKTVNEIYEAVAIDDIQQAADIFQSIYVESQGHDGYVSMEANPKLAYDEKATISEARRLFKAIDRPNVYIKVPATPAGIPAIRQLIAEGVNINVTLLFSVDTYARVAEAYLSGLEELAGKGGDLRAVSSVASFFVSRVDSKVDKMLEAEKEFTLRGKTGIANAKIAYQRFRDIFSGTRWDELAAHGARLQRPLWGSTSTKNPDYPDTLYVDQLIGPHTVNTVPPDTLEAFLDHGTVGRTLERDVEESQMQIDRLGQLGISLETVTDELLTEGVEKFASAFESLLEVIASRRSEHLAGATI